MNIIVAIPTKWCKRFPGASQVVQKGLSENTDQLFSVSTSLSGYQPLCLPTFFLLFPSTLVFVTVSAICIYIHMCHTKYKCSHTFLSALLTCVSFCNMSSVSGITSVDTFFLCSSSENYFPGHFARCTAQLLNLDCKYC